MQSGRKSLPASECSLLLASVRGFLPSEVPSSTSAELPSADPLARFPNIAGDESEGLASRAKLLIFKTPWWHC